MKAIDSTRHNHTMFLMQRNSQSTNFTIRFLQPVMQILYFPLQKHPRSGFFGEAPVARYFAAISSALRRSSPHLASIIALFSSADLWSRAILFFIFSMYSAFFFNNCSCSPTRCVMLNKTRTSSQKKIVEVPHFLCPIYIIIYNSGS
ncbi:hypothetical protein HAX54_016949 [Datura stramonium]|uniref:Uncharacterized protein n=1 Tax=Datura stramonium TaxID=4076 RepID=A0ABS8Y6L4_DATST|nr:hypothetical protein [Datura stramonium]